VFPGFDFVKVLQTAGIPVALVEDVLRRNVTGGRSEKGVFHGQGGCDIVYTWGDASIQYYRSIGVEAKRLIALGSPRMDRFVRVGKELPEPRVIREAEGLPTDNRVVLIAASSVYYDILARPLRLAEYLHCIALAIEWCRVLGAFALFKPHIGSIRDYEAWGVPQWIKSFPNAVYRADILLAKAVMASDAVLIFNSSVALEARLLGKPVGMLAADRYSHEVDYLDRGLCKKVDSVEDLRALLANESNEHPSHVLDAYLACRDVSAKMIVEDMLRRLKLSSNPRDGQDGAH
jgi:hypothetical protein